ncbi:MAG: inverse autotransporter beta domain-containing protein [Candidatus Omnitrophota bacterium]
MTNKIGLIKILHMVKKSLIILAIFNCFVFPAFALDSEESSDKQTTSQALDNQQDIPDWLTRTSFGLEGGSDKKLKYFIETVQPLLGTEEEIITLFNHTRLSLQDERQIFNTGFGIRKIFNESYLLGINAFYDYQDLNKHSRGGIGFEAVNDFGLEARLNTYFRISHEQIVEDAGASQFYEKVANGFDWEVGCPIPYLSAIRLYGGGYLYDFEHFRNKAGWKSRMEYTPIKNSRLVLEMFDDNKRDDIGFRVEGVITLAFTSFNWKDILKDLKLAKEPFSKIDLNNRKLDRVVRDFDITVIKSTKSGGLVIEGGRSN